MAGVYTLAPPFVNVDTDNVEARLGKCNCGRQTDIPQADDAQSGRTVGNPLAQALSSIMH
jgi:hypothetical protein